MDDTNGVILECNHVMDFARRMMGIDEHPLMRNFELRTDDVHFDFSGGLYS